MVRGAGVRFIADLGPRQVYWNLSDNVSAVVLQKLVQTLGPADGEVGKDDG